MDFFYIDVFTSTNKVHDDDNDVDDETSADVGDDWPNLRIKSIVTMTYQQVVDKWHIADEAKDRQIGYTDLLDLSLP